jgi:hypothetical protein
LASSQYPAVPRWAISLIACLSFRGIVAVILTVLDALRALTTGTAERLPEVARPIVRS